MIQPISSDTLSRIDKLFMDQDAIGIEESRRLRAQRGIEVLVGDDVKASYGLQLALLTAVNLGVKCFAGETKVHAAAEVWLAPCLVLVVRAATLGEAVVELGGKPTVWSGLPPTGRHLILGNAVAEAGAVRMTYDGWRIAVGPATEVPRMAEREYCQLASIAAASIAVGEVFADFAGISITATRRVVTFSLWRPDLSAEHPDGVGRQLVELPLAVGAFGLGHLGQAYLWGLAALPYSSRKDATILLCDDDRVEKANVETGALLTSVSVTYLKTRVAADWLETRGFSTRLLERRVDENFRRTAGEPVIALSGFDDNRARQWLSEAGFNAIFDSGLGGEDHNFDTIAFHTWPNPRVACDVWPLESTEELAAREARKRLLAASNAAYQALDADECGRLLLTGKSVAVPFVGAVAACVVLAEMLKTVNGGPVFSDLKLRLCSLGTSRLEGRLASEAAPPVRGVQTHTIKRVE
ncbi:hypothetical protein ACFQAT_28245 [Undibacterium arcticum]|uniref:Thiamine biosynthesis protein ThiF n=1 Tax=Undibacterium arcticum TaxID=1762892 RepID=A0ABV7F861_9BURK